MLSDNGSNLPASAIAFFVVGPLASGRTRFIEAIYPRKETYLETMPNGKQRLVTDYSQAVVPIDENESIYFFSNPTALHFPIDWIPNERRLLPPSLACILILFDPSRTGWFRTVKVYIETARETQIPYLVAANVRENKDTASQYEFIEAMSKHWGIDKINVCNALDKESVKKVVVELLQMLPAEPLTEQAILRVQSL